MKKYLRLVALFCLAFVVILVAMVADVQLRYVNRVFLLDTSPWPPKDGSRYGIVLGASVRSDGTPSPALQDRLDTAVWLHDRGFVKKIFLTGDDGAYHADEIDVLT